MTTPVRPQTRTDVFGEGKYGAGHFELGKTPVGGYQAVWAFNDKDCRNSATTAKVAKPDPAKR